MLQRALWAETLKYRRTLALTLALTAPILLTALHVLGYALTPSMHAGSPDGKWEWLSSNVFQLWAILFLPLGSAILAALATHLEHADNQLKHILTLPPPKATVYLTKFIAVLSLVLIGSLALSAGMIASAWVIGAGSSLDWKAALQQPLLAFMGIVPALALGVWLGMRWRSFVIGVGVALAGTVISMMAVRLPEAAFWKFVPWAYPYFAIATDPQQAALAWWLGGIVGLTVIAWGLFDFVRQDVS